MMKILNFTLNSLLLIFIPAVFLLPVLGGDARAQTCAVSICKSAESSGDTIFPFTIGASDISGRFGLFGEGEGSCVTIHIDQGATGFAIEDILPGWVLDNIDCELIGVDFNIVDNRVDFLCNASTVNGTCTFTNIPGETASNVPTLSEWGMIAAAAGLMLVGVFFVLRKRAFRA